MKTKTKKKTVKKKPIVKKKTKPIVKEEPKKQTSLVTKNLGGRPTKYEKRFCDMLIIHMSKGFSFESFAGLITVNRDTLYEWCKVHKEFSDSKKLAFEKNLLFWEEQGIKGMWSDNNVKFNSTAWIFNIKNRFGWVDRKDPEDINTLDAVTIKLPGTNKAQVISVNKATDVHDVEAIEKGEDEDD